MRLLDWVLSKERRTVVPLITYPTLKLLNVTVPQALSNPELHSEAARLSVDELGSDVALPLMDLTVEAESLGARVKMAPTEAPTIVEHLAIPESEDWQMPEVPDPEVVGRFPLFLKTAEFMKAKVRNAPVGFYLLGPFTLAGQLLGVARLLKSVRKNPELVSDLLELSTRLLTKYARSLADRGVDILVIAEPTAGLISPRDFSKFSQEFLAQMIDAVPSEWVLHICGQSGHLIEAMAETGVVGISVDHNVDLLEASKRVSDEVLLFGNYSPVKVALEPVSMVREEVRRLMEKMSHVPNFMLCTGCDVPYKAPLENIKALVEVGKSFPQPA